MESKFHEGFYSFAKYYDIAFDFKNIPEDCKFFTELYLKHSGRPLTSFIEFGSGPALHSLEMAKILANVTAVDLSEDMTNYAKEKANLQGVNLQCECADMITYSSHESFDFAALLMDSAAYLLTNDDFISHLKAVAKVLNPGGLYVLEMSHPKSVFEISKTTINEWEVDKDGIKVKMQWGSEDDKFDPITQLTDVSVRLEYCDGETSGLVEDRSAQRCFTATEFAALVAASGAFEIVEWYGSLNLEIPFNNSERSWRMVPVLKKL